MGGMNVFFIEQRKWNITNFLFSMTWIFGNTMLQKKIMSRIGGYIEYTSLVLHHIACTLIWKKVFNNGPSKICKTQPLKL